MIVYPLETHRNRLCDGVVAGEREPPIANRSTDVKKTTADERILPQHSTSGGAEKADAPLWQSHTCIKMDMSAGVFVYLAVNAVVIVQHQPPRGPTSVMQRRSQIHCCACLSRAKMCQREASNVQVFLYKDGPCMPHSLHHVSHKHSPTPRSRDNQTRFLQTTEEVLRLSSITNEADIQEFIVHERKSTRTELEKRKCRSAREKDGCGVACVPFISEVT